MSFKYKLFPLLNDKTYNYLNYYYLHLKCFKFPKILNLSNPKTFNEKIIWLKLNYHKKDNTLLADKLLVKDYVKNLIGGEYIIPTIKVFNNTSEIKIDDLPSQFVIKLNHGSGWNIICRDKNEFDFGIMKKKLDIWKNINYYSIGKEYQYKNIVPKIFCEKYLENSIKNPMVDYKVFCFGGTPKYIQVDLDRFSNHKRNFFDTEWNLIPFTTLYPAGDGNTKKPKQLKLILEIAKILSNGHPFSRIDLYINSGKVFFGEITFHHGGGFEPFFPSKYDYILGENLMVQSE